MIEPLIINKSSAPTPTSGPQPLNITKGAQPQLDPSVQRALNVAPSSQVGSATPFGDSMLGQVGNSLSNIGVGIGSALGKTALNIPKALLSADTGISNFENKVTGGVVPVRNYDSIKNGIDTLSNNIFQKPFEQQLDTTSGKTGEVIGTAAPYVASGGAIAGASNAATAGIEGAGLVPAALRVGAGALAEGAGNAATGYALSGGDTKQAAIQGVTGGVLKGATSAAGEALNASGAPEGLVSKIFRMNKNEAMSSLKGDGSNQLAKEVVDRGISGNTQEIAQQLNTGMQQAEQKLSEGFAQAGNPTIKLEDPQRFIDYVANKAAQLRTAGAVQEAKGLEASLGAIDPTTGEITANNALSLRRFLDGLRTQKSFMAPTEELQAQQAGLKEMADEIRHKISSIGGTGETMKDYQFYIKAMDKLASYAMRTKNNDALGLINTFLLGEGIAGAHPMLAGAAVARKSINTAGGATKAAQFIKNLGQSSAIGSGIRSVIGKALGQ